MMAGQHEDNMFRPAVMTMGEPYRARPSDTGLCGRITCTRCSRLIPYSQTEHDTHPLFKGRQQRRCQDRVACGSTKRGGA